MVAPGSDPRPRAVLLDAMGTLVQLEDPVGRLRAALRRRLGLVVGEDAARAALRAEIAYYRAHHREGRDARSLAALRRRCGEVLTAALPPPADAADPAAVTEALLAALRFRAFPDAAPALAALRARGLTLVAVSNWDVGLPDALAEAGLAAHLDGVVTSAAAGAAKPDPAIFARALELAGAPAAAALHCGDSPGEDVAGARATGVRPVLLARDGSAPLPPGVPPGVPVIGSLGELVSLLA